MGNERLNLDAEDEQSIQIEMEVVSVLIFDLETFFLRQGC